MVTRRYFSGERLTLGLLLAVIVGLPFSYYPLISFGSIAGMHLDGSLLYVLLALTVASSIPFVWKSRSMLLRSRALLWLSGFVLLCVCSILWSANQLRGTVTVLFLLMLIGLAGVVAIHLPSLKRYQHVAYRIISISTGISALWSLWQVYGDALGVTNSLTLLPGSYESTVFGVARPTGFALEPQFFASFLLIPFFWLIWRLLGRDRATSGLHMAGLATISTILLLTLSRGAIYAALAGLVLMIVLEHHNPKRYLLVASALLGGVAISGLIIFSAASINQRDGISGYGSLSKAVNHLSLGAISLPSQSVDSISKQNNTVPKPESDGYVAASTDSRLSMSSQAISLWSTNPQTILTGIGIGSFGSTLHAKDPDYSTASVVNNYYLEILVETGLIGTALFVAFAATLLYGLVRARQVLLIVILASLLIQACFFSGNANVVHLWVIVGLAIGTLLYQPKKLARLVQLN